jgi:hypothetical protein
MHKVVGALLASCLATLALAAPGIAADVPELQVIPYVTGLGAGTDTEVDLTIPAGAAATARIVLYAPRGYGTNVAQPAGTKIGDAAAAVDVGGTTLPLQGQVVADTPAKYTSDPKAQACAPGAHAAVWVIQLLLQGQAFSIPMFVDATSGAEASLGSFKLQTCFPSPYVPEAQGGAPFGAKFVEADIDFTSAFTNPSSASVYVWRSLLTPYTAGTATPDAAGTYELRSVAFIPVTFRVKARFDKKKRQAVLTGRLVLSGVAAGGRVPVIGGAGRDVSKWKLLGTATVKKGAVSFRKRLSKSTYLALLVPPEADTCFDGQPPAAPAGCIRETTAPAISNVVRVVVPKKRR